MPGDSSGFLPFFDKARFVHHQHPLLLPQVFHDIGLQSISHGFFIPVGFSQHPLYSTRAVFAQGFGQLPSIFAFERREQAS